MRSGANYAATRGPADLAAEVAALARLKISQFTKSLNTSVHA